MDLATSAADPSSATQAARPRRSRDFHALKVADIRRETDEAVSVAFAVPDELEDSFRFTQGQYLTLRTHVNGEELRRPYSVCVAPEEDELRICVKKLHGGRFSSFVNDNSRSAIPSTLWRPWAGSMRLASPRRRAITWVLPAGRE
jgi:ring-1,2-phenylacetyl-CoA epoxidase subunit PaaE